MPSAMNFKFRNAFNKFISKKCVVDLRERLGRGKEEEGKEGTLLRKEAQLRELNWGRLAEED